MSCRHQAILVKKLTCQVCNIVSKQLQCILKRVKCLSLHIRDMSLCLLTIFTSQRIATLWALVYCIYLTRVHIHIHMTALKTLALIGGGKLCGAFTFPAKNNIRRLQCSYIFTQCCDYNTNTTKWNGRYKWTFRMTVVEMEFIMSENFAPLRCIYSIHSP